MYMYIRYTYTPIHIHLLSYMYMYTYTPIHIHLLSYMYMYIWYTYTPIHIHLLSYMYMYTHTPIHIYLLSYIQYTHTPIHTCTCNLHICMYRHTVYILIRQTYIRVYNYYNFTYFCSSILYF